MSDKKTSPLLEQATRRLFTGISLSTLMLGVSYACNFLLVPFMLRAWGPSGYSSWVSLVAVVSYLGLFDLGGQVYIQNLLAASFARNDLNDFRATLCQGMALYLWLGVGGLIFWLGGLSLGLQWALPVLGRPLAPDEFFVLLILGANQFLVSIPFGVFATVYRASGHFTRATFLTNVSKLTLFALSIGVLVAHGKVWMLACMHLVVGSLTALFLLHDSRRIVPCLLPLDLSWASARASLRLLKGSLFNWLIAVANLFNQSVPLLLIAKYASPELVALFATHRMIAAVATYAPGIVSGPIQPEFSYLWSLAHHDRFRQMFVRSLVALLLVTGGAALALYASTPLFFERWTSGRVSFDSTLLTLLLMQAVTGTGSTVVGWALIASNRHRAFSLACLAYALVFAAVLLAVVPVWGVHGAIGANLILDFCYLVAVLPLLSARVIRLSASVLIRAVGVAFAVIGLIALVIGTVVAVLPAGWNTATALVLLVGVSLGILAFLWRRWRPAAPASAAHP